MHIKSKKVFVADSIKINLLTISLIVLLQYQPTTAITFCTMNWSETQYLLLLHKGYQRSKDYPQHIKARKEHSACHVMRPFEHVNNLQENY